MNNDENGAGANTTAPLMCADCGQPIREPEAYVKVEHDFIVHQTCMDYVESSWRQFKADMKEDGIDIDKCKFLEENIMSEENDPLKPNATLLINLGSALVHAEEFLSPHGHPADKAAFDSIMLKMPEVRAWIDQMTALALLPVKRQAPAVKEEDDLPKSRK